MASRDWNGKKNLHKEYVTFHCAHTHTDTHTYNPTNLPFFKWTVLSWSKQEPGRRRGVVTPQRPLVQSARLLLARLGTAE